MSRCFLFAAAIGCLIGVPAIISGPGPAAGPPGGYAPAALTDDVRAAADFAVHEEAKRDGSDLKLVSISKADKQIVAGVNFRLVLKIDRSGSTEGANVIVFRDIKSRFSLTSWQWLNGDVGH